MSMSEQTRRNLDTSIPSVEDAALYWQWGGYMWHAPERFYRMIAKVKADALREAAMKLRDGIGSCNTGCHVSDMMTLQTLADRIEGEA